MTINDVKQSQLMSDIDFTNLIIFPNFEAFPIPRGSFIFFFLFSLDHLITVPIEFTVYLKVLKTFYYITHSKSTGVTSGDF